VAQRLALGRLPPPILTAYRKGAIHAGAIRNLTMATPKQQKDWWALMKDEDAYAPTGQRLKSWLFGGEHIPTLNALFDVEESGLAVVADLFGEDSYFADAEAFWTHQNTALAEVIDTLKAEGWAGVIVKEVGAYFAAWDHQSRTKDEGGKVFVTTTQQGEVTFHKGYITNSEAKRRDKADTAPAEKPELTKAAQNYVDLHRHAAVRADMLGQGSLALRLVAAHMLAGSSLWSVEKDPQKAAKPEIAESLEASTAQQSFEKEREAIAELLGIETAQILPERSEWYVTRPDMGKMLTHLMTLEDGDVLRILTFLMADSLSVHSPVINDLAQALCTDMSNHWQPEQTFFALIRDKQVLNSMVGEFAGANAAVEHITSTAKAHRDVLSACLNGNRKPADPNWMPRYLAFPQGSYREDGATDFEQAGEAA
jgi:ParB family chromosome partitioning protein